MEIWFGREEMVTFPCSTGDNAKALVLKQLSANICKYYEKIDFNYLHFLQTKKVRITTLRDSA